MPMTPLAFIDQYLARYQSHNPALWNYEDGCVLTGCRQLYQATGEEKYLRFVLDYLDARVAADGTIPTFDTGNYNIDAINCGKALFLAWDATGEEKYRKALDFHARRLAGHPRCVCGSFWHKEIYPWQVWLDGLYMAQPFAMEYETRFGGRAEYGDILRQFRNARTYLYDPAKGLSYHGWDESRQQPWSNPDTGCSPNFWSRAMGWYLMALIDAVEACDPAIYEVYRALCDQFREAVRGILPYQDAATGMIYQVIDRPDVPGNYLEASGSAMLACAILKGVRLKVLLADKYLPHGLLPYETLTRDYLRTDAAGQCHLEGICSVAGLGPGNKRDGSVAYYLSEKVVADDPKGVGAYMMATAQKIMLP